MSSFALPLPASRHRHHGFDEIYTHDTHLQDGVFTLALTAIAIR